MERPVFVPRDPRFFTVTHEAPVNGRLFVSDQSRWYERLRDDNGDGYFVHVADTDEEFHRRLEEEGESAAVEADEDDPLVALASEEFAAAGRLYPEVAVITDDDLAAA